MIAQPKRGGARPGAGRPTLGAQKRVMLAVRLPPDLVELLRAHPESQSVVVERALRAELDAPPQA